MSPKTALPWIILAPFALIVLALLAVNALSALSREEQPAPRIRRVHSSTADPLEAGHAAMEAGDLETAQALWLEIEPDHPQFSRAQRFLGWKLHARHRGDPLAGIPHVNRALLEDPFDRNAWQDWSRTYAASLGFDVGQERSSHRLDWSTQP